MVFARTYFLRINTLSIILSLSLVSFASADAASDQQAALQAQLNQVNAEIAQNQAALADKQKERTSLEKDVSVLNYQISEAQLEIKQRDLTIQKLKSSSMANQSGIVSLDAQVGVGEQSIAQILREINEIDNTSLTAKLLGGSLQQYFSDVDDFATIQHSLDQAFTKMATERQDLSARKDALDQQQQEQSDLLDIQLAQKNSLKNIEQQKQDLVTTAKGQEAVYASTIATKQKTASQIEAALFALRDTSQQVSFGDIYTYAKQASALTGVRPAVILGILSEETNMGQNIGSCSYQEAMHPTRDVPIFLQLMAQLGLDPNAEKVSCKPSYGWGGAMGPAQFIPSTWVQYVDRIAQMAGQNPPNPYDPRTATFAAAILMKDNGADAGTRDAERLAALRYFAGWKNAGKAAYAFYGDDVMSLADKFQSDINVVGS